MVTHTLSSSANPIEPIENQLESTPAAKRQRLEAVLFLARQPLTTRRISQLAHLADGTEARVMMKALNEHYNDVGRSFHVKRVAGGFQLLTRPQFIDWISRTKLSRPMIRLSASAQETLTVVAYRQPMTKADIETVRGVGCGEMLRQLLEKGLVKIAGRSEDLGRPFLYATTKQFLTEFGFGSLDQLPEFEELSGEGLPDWEPSDPEASADTDEADEAEEEWEEDEDEDEEWDEDEED